MLHTNLCIVLHLHKFIYEKYVNAKCLIPDGNVHSAPCCKGRSLPVVFGEVREC